MKSLIVFLLFIGMLCFSSLLHAQSTVDQTDVFNAFTQQTGAISTFGKTTQTPNFIRFPKEEGLSLSGGNLSQKVDQFLGQNGALFQFRQGVDLLVNKETKTDNYGFQSVITQQHFQGVPVYDGLVKFHFNQKGKLRTINGNFLPVLALDTKAKINLEDAKKKAIALVESQGINPSGIALKAHQATLYVFNKGLAAGAEGKAQLVYEVEVRNDRDVREFVFIDAHQGKLVEQYTGMAHALSRKLYETSTANQIWTEGDAFPGSLDQWQQNELAAAEDSYHFFNNAFGWTSYDGADAEMRTVNNDPGISCPNANWNGLTANYCTGTASDDVVAHEWGHAYTEYTCGLIYAYQSGAMNESLSDIWGETIDLYNAYEDAGEDHSLRTACSSSDRWRMGEGATSFGGAIRDMWDPTCDGDPGKVGDAEYACGKGDSGGVHSNSGVPNHAYALLVDGGTYNGQTITGIGFTKAAHIFWRAQSVYLTKTSDFEVLADALEASCTDLLGINLEGLTTEATPVGPSGEIITASDLAELQKVLTAVELRVNPDACAYSPLLVSTTALCTGATASHAIFFEDFETGLGAWSVSQIASNPSDWTSRDWVIDNTPPDNRTGNVAFGTNPSIGNCSTDFENGILRLQSPVISIPAGTPGTIELAFDHYVSMEDDYDGGNIKYRLDGGSWTLLPSAAFTANPYNQSLITSGNDNPLAGQTAFTGADEGAVSGTWGQSQIDLSAIGVGAGADIEFRWEIGVDGCNGWDGWYIDDISVYTCEVPSIAFAATGSEVLESSANISNACMDYLEVTVTLEIDAAPSAGATVMLNAPTGSATLGADADYTFTPNEITLDAVNRTQDITVRIYDDAVVDGDETIVWSYSINANGGNAFAGTLNQSYTLTIKDDDLSPEEYTAELINETFASGLGSFTTTTSGTSSFSTADAATASSLYYRISTTNATDFAYINDDDCNCDLSEVRLISPAMDLTHATSVSLTFDHAFADLGTEAFDLIVSTDGGGSWSSSIYSVTNTSTHLGSGVYQVPWVTDVNVNLSAYVGNADVKFAFQYNDGNSWLYGAAIDNVVLSAEQPKAIQTAVNTGTTDEQYLGPLQTVHFYDLISGNIMATVENLSSHDYGCTTVEVKRGGTGAAEAWSADAADFITEKALQITPSNNNPSGSYRIMVYYTEAEIAGWEAATGRDRSELVLLKTTNDITNPQVADPREDATITPGTLGGDLTYTATFNTGFSSFSIGPPTALPVEFLYFRAQLKTNTIDLYWQTATEINSDFFEVERSSDGVHFNKIGRVRSKGVSGLGATYLFEDADYHRGENYYRLKQVDDNGSFDYSTTVLVDAGQKNTFAFYPNPVRSMLSLELPVLSEGSYEVKVFNAAGQLVLEKELADDKTEGANLLNMSALLDGTYYFNVAGTHGVYNFKVIKMAE